MAVTRNDLLFIEAAVNAGLSQDTSIGVEYSSIYRNGDESVIVEYSNTGSYTRHRKVVTTRDKSFLQTLLTIVAAVREVRKEAKS